MKKIENKEEEDANLSLEIEKREKEESDGVPVKEMKKVVGSSYCESDESTSKETQEEEVDEGIPEYVPEEAHGHEEEANLEEMNEPGSRATDEAAVETDDLANSAAIKGKQKVGEPSGLATLVSPKASPALSVDDTEVEVEDEDFAADLVSRVRHSGKRRASFSPSRPLPKVLRVVEFVDSSSGGEDTDDQMRRKGNGDQTEEANIPHRPHRDQNVDDVCPEDPLVPES
ncbi:hypothetical protein LWI29_031868 [Acer saccharum]|uniref:Uncharacterized protein n=1 Tax=Acer saccharum TaxID=4024 RepID=A0AA39RPA2_ACESA|nr:hypothetical protein LWI29_031868 [Acer saccharum]